MRLRPVAATPSRQLREQLSGRRPAGQVRVQLGQLALCQPWPKRTKRIVDPQSVPTVSDKSRPIKDPEVPGSFRLGNPKHLHEIADAELTVIEQEPKHLEPGLVGENPKELGRILHYVTSRESILITGLADIVKWPTTK